MVPVAPPSDECSPYGTLYVVWDLTGSSCFRSFRKKESLSSRCWVTVQIFLRWPERSIRASDGLRGGLQWVQRKYRAKWKRSRWGDSGVKCFLPPRPLLRRALFVFFNTISKVQLTWLEAKELKDWVTLTAQRAGDAFAVESHRYSLL